MSKQNIVVVGGGAAGAELSRALSAKLDPSQYNILLITTRDHFIHIPAAPRMVVTSDGKLEDYAVFSYDNNFIKGNGKLHVGTVTAVEKDTSGNGGTVVLETGERVPFRFLVIATGSHWEGPLDYPIGSKVNIDAFVSGWRQKFAAAKDIALVGGGAVGIELAGELRDTFPDKKITIVHGGELLLNDTYPKKFRKDLGRRLALRKIDVILDDRIDNIPAEGGVVTTAKGKTLNADLVVLTRGGRPNTGFLKSLGSDVLTSSGHVKVLPTLQLKAHSDIFAVGDVIDYPEQKQLAKIPGQVAIAAPNLIALINGQKATKEYKGGMEAIFVTIGKGGGAGFMNALWGLTFGDTLVGSIKSKGLFVSMARKGLGHPA